MKIAYVGRLSMQDIEESFQFDCTLPKVNWGLFPLGSLIVKQLLARGHEVHAITTCCVDKTQCYRSGKLTLWAVPCPKRSRWSYLTLFALEIRGIVSVLKTVCPDVVFSQWLYYNTLAGIISGVPTLAVAHDSPWRIVMATHTVQSLVKAFFAQLFVFPKIKHITTVSEYMVGELHHFNRYKGEVKVIPNGIEIDSESLGMNEKNVREDARTIVCVSQWDRRKNPTALLIAFSILREKHRNWKLKIFGQGIDDEIAGKWMKREHVEADGIELCGVVSRATLDRILKDEADVFCSPTLEESFGMVFVEAMLRGVPCVGGEKSGAVPWVMGEGGVTCDVEDPQKLADCLERVMTDWELRKQLSAGGVRHVRDHFNIERVVDMYEEELLRVAKD